MPHRDTKWTDAVGKMVPVDLAPRKVCHKPSVCKKPQYLWSAIKGDMPIHYYGILIFQVLITLKFLKCWVSSLKKLSPLSARFIITHIHDLSG